MNKKGKKIAVILYMIGAIMFIVGSITEIRNENTLNSAKKQYNSLFINNIPNNNITSNDITTLEKKIKKIANYYKKDKNRLSTNLREYKKYFNLKNKIFKKYDGKYITASITDQEITNYKEENKKINKKYQKIILNYINDIEKQKVIVDNIEKNIDNLFDDPDNLNLKDNITEQEIEKIINKVNDIPQKKAIARKISVLNTANDLINLKNKEINEAWIKLDLPYISQNKNGVLNGCEAASLLMSLQYKGYLKDTSITNFATNMPKSSSNNAEEGFTHDIFGEEPKNVPHWIAPNALAEYGRNSSGNQTIYSTTNWTIDQLDQELDNNNPIIIYVTAKLKPLKSWSEGAPTNLHVMVLAGYNKITGQQLLIDPWTHDDGRISWIIEKNELENIYNAIGRKSVLIK